MSLPVRNESKSGPNEAQLFIFPILASEQRLTPNVEMLISDRLDRLRWLWVTNESFLFFSATSQQTIFT